LSRVGVREFSELQIYQDQGTKTTVKKQQINSVPLVADAKALLPGDECEIASEFKQKVFQMKDERLLQIALGVLIFQV
jgi:hypothetical protein